MANASDELESKRTQLVETLSTVADAMRNCATIADQFVQILAQGPGKTTSATKRKAKELAEDGEEKPKKKRQPKKERDPNEPKRPASAYIMFQNEVRKELKSKHPGVPQGELLAMISKQWTEMTDEQKLVYNQANRSAKEKYSADKAAYDATKAPNANAVGATPAPVEKKPVKAAKPTPKPERKSAPLVHSSASSVSVSEESSEEEEDDDDDDDDDDDEEDRRAAKKSKSTPVVTPLLKEKKQRKH